MAIDNLDIRTQLQRNYSAGFITDIESDTLPPGLDEDVVRFISTKKNEPEWLTQWRLAAYRHWRKMDVPSRSEEHTSELQSLMRISYAVFCLKTKKITIPPTY